MSGAQAAISPDKDSDRNVIRPALVAFGDRAPQPTFIGIVKGSALDLDSLLSPDTRPR
jgi:hypothetical protein